MRARRAAVQNGQRAQRDGRPDAERNPHAPPPRAPPPAAGQGQRRPRRARIALKPLKPRASIRDDLGPQTAVCTHCKAQHWECERSKSTGHFSRCCSQGKVQLPNPPQPNLEYRQLPQGSDSEAKAFRDNAQSYNNALCFTSLAAHWDQAQMGTLGPPQLSRLRLSSARFWSSVVPWLTGDCQHCSNQKRLRASSGSFSFRCSVGARLPDQ
ncbi:BQ5605_C022g09580 [Microbotryum silenes-dioicae]|uniref:BQ5605_C022g09580 protein n=1 Tax=Microbotryum silenes-dioicae TaxID=796604 RepID=A0A2X0MNM5_9BASI|nr:BQ5605_C022g09580 [Microbotryum silenes-dioicae]